MNILFLGSPGSGKGTQADLVEKKLGFAHFSTGEMLRSYKGKDKEMDEAMKRGEMVSDEKVIDLAESYILEHNLLDKDLIIDGSPRNLYQYERLKQFLSKHGRQVDLAICITISDNEVVRRLTARRTDKKTRLIYNLVTNPPGPEIDPKDLVQRDDDSEESVRQRLKVQKIPSDLLEALKQDGVLVEVDGERSVNDIFEDIKAKIMKLRTNNNE